MPGHWWTRPAREQKRLRRWANVLVRENAKQRARKRVAIRRSLEAKRQQLRATLVCTICGGSKQMLVPIDSTTVSTQPCPACLHDH